MENFEKGDWFVFAKGQEAYQIERVEGELVVYEDERGMELTVPVESLVKVSSPYPKLEALAMKEEVWASEPNPTFNELMQKALREFPSAYLEEMSGEIVIWTGYKATHDLNSPLESMEEEE